ncbi:hypothetical protein BD324DRAFT_96762 [Kockovaella imperatae]|uniref:Uncharacterized protein n=1 Tax=Kockovaella imperatae TaxID=4999 RepID=A0A1Y1UBJ1_9TREE|nr:hypothetical protein BD324DRAFT_96762 [Kockovaella imperatae]ORX35411.1 hypothetical protein BD324DRAFT_96762 [Kockovaella imperatae]
MSLSMSYGTSPGTGFSLLNPPNPSFAPIDSVPRGGILLNSRRLSDSPKVRPVDLAFTTIGSSSLSSRNMTSFESDNNPQTPETPVVDLPSGANHLSPVGSSPMLSPSESGHSHSARIRFAPLPDPRRPRSLSTGRNIAWVAGEGPTGETTRTVELRGVKPDQGYNEEYVDDESEDDFLRRRSEGESDDEEKRGRRWSRTMGSWGKGTKKLFGLKDAEDAYSDGAPLKKSVSTGGFIGSSPFRWSSETERKNTMQGLSPNSSLNNRPDHRRNSSMESPSLGSSLSSSPQPVRMLNGRVYGSRRAIEAAEKEKQWREQNEPAFIEWGHGKQGAGLGSNSAPSRTSGGGGFLGDAEEGSGMEWVKKRREERQKRAAEEKRMALEGFRLRSNSDGPNPSDDAQSGSGGTVTEPSTFPSIASQKSNLSNMSTQPTPIIQVSEHLSPAGRSPSGSGGHPEQDHTTRGAAQPPATQSKDDHVTRAIQVPIHPDHDKDRVVRGVDIFGDGRESDSDRSSDESSRKERISDEQVIEDDDDEDEDDQDDEYTDDEEDEDEDATRTTSSAAGVEKVSRHKD